MMPYLYPPNVSGYGGFGGIRQAGIQFPSLQLPMMQPPNYNQTFYQHTTYPSQYNPGMSGSQLNSAFNPMGMPPNPTQQLTAAVSQLPQPAPTPTPTPQPSANSSSAFSASGAVDPQQNLSFQQPQNNPLQGRKAPPRRGYFGGQSQSSPLMSSILSMGA